jgi:hypothetical protein
MVKAVLVRNGSEWCWLTANDVCVNTCVNEVNHRLILSRLESWVLWGELPWALGLAMQARWLCIPVIGLPDHVPWHLPLGQSVRGQCYPLPQKRCTELKKYKRGFLPFLTNLLEQCNWRLQGNLCLQRRQPSKPTLVVQESRHSNSCPEPVFCICLPTCFCCILLWNISSSVQ